LWRWRGTQRYRFVATRILLDSGLAESHGDLLDVVRVVAERRSLAEGRTRMSVDGACGDRASIRWARGLVSIGDLNVSRFAEPLKDVILAFVATRSDMNRHETTGNVTIAHVY
jgi:hypothetical protein